MARKRPHKLTHAFVNSVSTAGRYGDARGGHGLSLLVKATTIPGRWSKTWSQSLRVNRSPVTVALGAYPAVTLAMARAKALEIAALAAQGIDPRAPQPSIPTLDQAFDQMIGIRTPTWTGQQTAGNWARAKRFCQPLGSMLVSDIKPTHVLEILENLWTANPCTARDVRSKLSSVFQLTITQGHRDSDPANRQITQHLGRQPRQSHHNSIDHTKLGSALKLVRDAHTWWAVKMALIFLALTCTRSSEVLKATWDEFDLDSELPTWTIPASRMKNRLAHTVPSIHPGGRSTALRTRDDRWRRTRFSSSARRPFHARLYALVAAEQAHDTVRPPRSEVHLQKLGRAKPGDPLRTRRDGLGPCTQQLRCGSVPQR